MKIFAALEKDAHEGWVWLYNPNLPARCVVKITNPANRKSIYCEALQIESNFLKQYNQTPRINITEPSSTIVIGAWFRASLGGLETKSEIPLKIESRQSCWGQYKASTSHPQAVVRLAANLGGIGLILGIAGLVLGIISLL
ncbi:MAG: hypothetical protein PHR16_17405 [Methylovulum sp.]|nr:hypothetical protein [Methylovulum sp.]